MKQLMSGNEAIALGAKEANVDYCSAYPGTPSTEILEEIPKVKAETKVVPRPPALCPGCPHRGFYYAIGKVTDAVVAGDIGCYGLGAGMPLNAIDAMVCMGGSLTMATGMAKPSSAKARPRKKYLPSSVTRPSFIAA